MKQMKLLIGVAMLLVMGTSTLSAQAIDHSIRVTVPFAFSVNGKTLEAGDYLVSSLVDNAVAIKGMNGELYKLSLTNPAESLNPTEPKLVFRHYGEKYILTQAWFGYSHYGRVFSVAGTGLKAARNEAPITILAAK
jgi:hypothetical protein